MVPYQMEVWNTETGAWCSGIYQGANSNYRLVGENTSQANRAADTFFRGFNFEAERIAYGVLAWLFDHSKGMGNLTAVPKTRQGLKDAATEASHDVGDMGSDVQ